MNFISRRLLAVLLCLGLCLPVLTCIRARAAEPETQEEQIAEDISQYSTITECKGLAKYALFDEQRLFGSTAENGAYFTLEHEKRIGSIYMIFQYEYGPYEVVNNDTGEMVTVGHERFLHQFLDMNELFGSYPESVTVNLNYGPVSINDMHVFTPGKVPDYVQKWKMPKEGETDLILFSAHADDEHLFFAGVLPTYAVERDMEVLVVYLTNHRNYTPIRAHEILNGLWAIGIDTYPIIPDYIDFHIKDMEYTYNWYESHGVSRDELLGYVVEQMRRFKPKVVVTHDFEGEYGHGQHMVCADLVAKAVQITNDASKYPELAEKYGTWDVSKAYFHLYEENPIVMDWDQPLESYGGMTAFEVSTQVGFQMHITQIKDFTWYYKGFPDAKSLTRYNPCYYGLYRSTVGEDVAKNDFFENVTTHAQDRAAEAARLEEEARLKAEEESRKKAEEEARLKAQQEAQKKAQAEADAKLKAEAEANAKLAQEEAAQTRKTIILVMAVITIVAAVFALIRSKKKKI